MDLSAALYNGQYAVTVTAGPFFYKNEHIPTLMEWMDHIGNLAGNLIPMEKQLKHINCGISKNNNNSPDI